MTSNRPTAISTARSRWLAATRTPRRSPTATRTSRCSKPTSGRSRPHVDNAARGPRDRRAAGQPARDRRCLDAGRRRAGGCGTVRGRARAGAGKPRDDPPTRDRPLLRADAARHDRAISARTRQARRGARRRRGGRLDHGRPRSRDVRAAGADHARAGPDRHPGRRRRAADRHRPRPRDARRAGERSSRLRTRDPSSARGARAPARRRPDGGARAGRGRTDAPRAQRKFSAAPATSATASGRPGARPRP